MASYRFYVRLLLTRVFSVLWLPVFLPCLLLVVPVGRLITFVRHRRGMKPRIVWGAYVLPQTVYMAMADRMYGYDSRLLAWVVSYYNRAWEIPWHVYRFSSLYRLLVLPRYIGFLWSVLRFDIFQYYFDQHQLQDTVFETLELPILKAAGKYLVISPYGSDVLLPGIRAYGNRDYYALVAQDYPASGTARWRRRVQRNIALAIKAGDCVISVVPLSDCIPVSHVKRHYIAIDTCEWHVAHQGSGDGPIKIVHASNHRHNKGSDIIIEVCTKLQMEGYPIDFTLLERVPREEAKRICREADIIVEQVLAGCFGMFGIECMAMGKPVMAYLREDRLEHHPWMIECPVVNVTPENLRQRLLELVNDPEQRQKLGAEGRRYVERYHSIASIGALNDQIYRSLWYGEGQIVAVPELTPAAQQLQCAKNSTAL